MDVLRFAVDDAPHAHHSDVAALAQRTVESVMHGLTAYALRATGSRKLCLAGGVALNCVANGLLIDLCDDIFVQPAANDAGVALGAALWAAVERGEAISHFHGVQLG